MFDYHTKGRFDGEDSLNSNSFLNYTQFYRTPAAIKRSNADINNQKCK